MYMYIHTYIYIYIYIYKSKITKSSEKFVSGLICFPGSYNNLKIVEEDDENSTSTKSVTSSAKPKLKFRNLTGIFDHIRQLAYRNHLPGIHNVTDYISTVAPHPGEHFEKVNRSGKDSNDINDVEEILGINIKRGNNSREVIKTMSSFVNKSRKKQISNDELEKNNASRRVDNDEEASSHMDNTDEILNDINRMKQIVKDLDKIEKASETAKNAGEILGYIRKYGEISTKNHDRVDSVLHFDDENNKKSKGSININNTKQTSTDANSIEQILKHFNDTEKTSEDLSETGKSSIHENKTELSSAYISETEDISKALNKPEQTSKGANDSDLINLVGSEKEASSKKDIKAKHLSNGIGETNSATKNGQGPYLQNNINNGTGQNKINQTFPYISEALENASKALNKSQRTKDTNSTNLSLSIENEILSHDIKRTGRLSEHAGEAEDQDPYPQNCTNHSTIAMNTTEKATRENTPGTLNLSSSQNNETTNLQNEGNLNNTFLSLPEISKSLESYTNNVSDDSNGTSGNDSFAFGDLGVDFSEKSEIKGNFDTKYNKSVVSANGTGGI